MRISLEGMAVMVTGAASGIGAAIAALAAEAGARLFLVDRNPIPCPTGAVAHLADLSDPATPAAACAAMIAAFGRIDGLVNAAGLTTRGGVADGTLATWESLVAINARAHFFLMQGAIADLRARGAAGSIVNIQSMHAHGGIPTLGIYACTKGMLQTLTKNAAAAHLADRIRVNGINLGWVDTPAERQMQAVTLGRGEGWLADEAARLPLGRLLTPDDCARTAVFLLSPASAPMTGVSVDLEQRVAG